MIQPATSYESADIHTTYSNALFTLVSRNGGSIRITPDEFYNSFLGIEAPVLHATIELNGDLVFSIENDPTLRPDVDYVKTIITEEPNGEEVSEADKA